MNPVIILAFALVGLAQGAPANETEVVVQGLSTSVPTQSSYLHYTVVDEHKRKNDSRNGTSSNDTETSTHRDTTPSPTNTTPLPATTTMPSNSSVPKTIESCDQKICEEKICRVNGSISRPSFYARCPTLLENDQDLTKYCMCAAAYHATPEVTSTGETRPSYITITPDVNCDVPITEHEKNQCEQDKCQGVSKKTNRLAHICQVENKFYCACFN